MPRTEATDGPIQSARHAKAIYAKLLRHRGFADRAYFRLQHDGIVGLCDEYPKYEERYTRNKAIADECENRILAWMDRLIESERREARLPRRGPASPYARSTTSMADGDGRI